MTDPNPYPSRRSFVKSALAATLVFPTLSLYSETGDSDSNRKARFTARPGEPTEEPVYGFDDLKLDNRRDGYTYCPKQYDPEQPVPLLIMLHGNGGNAKKAWDYYSHVMDQRGMILLAIDSRRRSWDMMMGGFGPDIEFIDKALAQTFSRYRIDPKRIAIGGFSDGASYALTVGAANGDFFSHLIAFAPGSIGETRPIGRPRVFVSHGTKDQILPVRSSRSYIVPNLKRAHYDVTYLETDLTHEVNWEITMAAMDWFQE